MWSGTTIPEAHILRKHRVTAGPGLSVAFRYHVADVGAVDGQGGEDDDDDPDRPRDVEGAVGHGLVALHDPGGAFPDHRRPRPAGQVPVRVLLAGRDTVPGPVDRTAHEVHLDGIAGRGVHAVHHQPGQDADHHRLPWIAGQVGAQPGHAARYVDRIAQEVVGE